ncbi:flagellar motor switch protein FliM [Desulfatirhabdium butyrativorans]|uniref:flagellar motor switch protein FliM n=1 Tax=Desulfatirhabdium butyrativorans TaxID=340467 RepID=UPI000410F738|nr:flagellar motor switch protein FliM [Desulfatirhabdium butyrativorans]
MTDQILSQEEIDALLGAMAKGEVNLSEEKRAAPAVVPYDLTSQRIMMREEFYALSEVYDKFTGMLQIAISAMLQRSFEVRIVSTEMVKFGDFIKAFSNPTSFNLFSMEPLIGMALIAIETNLAFSLIDCMFGGDGKPLVQNRDFTVIEQRMLVKFAQEVLSNFEKAWENVFPVKITLRKTESKAEFVHMVNPNDQVIVIAFTIAGKEFSANLYACISYLMLEPIKEKLSSKYLREKDIAYAWRPQLERLLDDAPVVLIAELGRTMQSLRDLLEMEVDDVLKLNAGPEDPVTIRIQNTEKFYGLPGVAKGNRAVEITRMLSAQGEHS